MVDKVKPLKIEDATSGAESDPFPVETDPTEDYLACKGIALENNNARLIDLDGSGNIQFKDATETAAKTVRQLRTASENLFDNSTNLFTAAQVQAAIEEARKGLGASAYGASSPAWWATPGSSAPIPLNTTEYQSISTMHDTTVTDSGTATGTQSSTTLQDTSKSWTTNQFAGYVVKLTGGTGVGLWRLVVSNTSNTLTVAAWDTTPVSASTTYQLTLKAGRLYAPVDGIYAVKAHASISYQALVLGLQVYKNGSFHSVNYTHQGQTVELNCVFAKDMSLVAGDYLDLRIYNGDSAIRQMTGGNSRLFFQMKL